MWLRILLLRIVLGSHRLWKFRIKWLSWRKRALDLAITRILLQERVVSVLSRQCGCLESETRVAGITLRILTLISKPKGFLRVILPITRLVLTILIGATERLFEIKWGLLERVIWWWLVVLIRNSLKRITRWKIWGRILLLRILLSSKTEAGECWFIFHCSKIFKWN